MSGKTFDFDEEDVVIRQFKIIILGDGAVGKTSIANRFTDDKFSQNYKQTIWDIGGQSIGSKMITNYITGADAVLLCYDITNYESFANLEDWYRLVLRAFQGKTLPYVALLGNKNDLRHLAVVKNQQHTRFSDENNMASFLMSAKNGDQVKHCFWKVAATLAGVPFQRFEQESQAMVLPATIIDHKRHDETVNEGKVPEYTKSTKASCTIS